LVAAVAVSVGAASHLTVVDHAAAQALLELARRVDERRPGDNVSLPTFLKLCESLGLTPLARRSLSGDASLSRSKESGGDSGGGRVAGDGGEASELERKRRELRARFESSAG
jgi:hypothetical protein